MNLSWFTDFLKKWLYCNTIFSENKGNFYIYIYIFFLSRYFYYAIYQVKKKYNLSYLQ